MGRVELHPWPERNLAMRVKDQPHITPDEMLRSLLDVLTSLKNGHLTAHMPDGFPGIYGKIAATLNEHLDQLSTFRHEHHRLMEEVGVTGRLGGQMEVAEVEGAWREMLEDVNRLGGNVTRQFREGANVVRDVMAGELPARMSEPCIGGEFAEFREQLNGLVDAFEERSTKGVGV
jgi:hypothetical protein